MNYKKGFSDYDEDDLNIDDTDEGIVNEQLNTFSQKKMFSALTNTTAIEVGASTFTQQSYLRRESPPRIRQDIKPNKISPGRDSIGSAYTFD